MYLYNNNDNPGDYQMGEGKGITQIFFYEKITYYTNGLVLSKINLKN